MSEKTFRDPIPDRMPTQAEERAAEAAADDVDLASVAEHAEEMAEKGAHVRGEGAIEP
jgi:hypothetical protein